MLSFNHYAYGADDRLGLPHRRRASRPTPTSPATGPCTSRRVPAGGLDRASGVDRDARSAGSRSTGAVDDGVFEATLEVPFGARAVLDLPVTDESDVTVDGAPAPTELGHGTHRIRVTAPAVAQPSAAASSDPPHPQNEPLESRTEECHESA